jgi:hypothetical protein
VSSFIHYLLAINPNTALQHYAINMSTRAPIRACFFWVRVAEGAVN